MQTIAWGSDELIRQYQYLGSGHFFDKDTLRFFRSRVTSNYARVSDSVALFITTESGPFGASPRRATVRKATLVNYTRESDGRECQKIEIDKVGEFNQLTLARAKTVLRDEAKRLREEVKA